MAIVSLAVIVPLIWVATALFRAAGFVQRHWRGLALGAAALCALATVSAMLLLPTSNAGYEQGDSVLRAMLD